MTVPESCQTSPSALSRKMWNADEAVSHRSAHQIPSLNQSLLSGFEPDGAVAAPVNARPLIPTCGAVTLSWTVWDVATGRATSRVSDCALAGACDLGVARWAAATGAFDKSIVATRADAA